MEASALPASVGLGRTRIVIGGSLLRIRSDEQLVTLFRQGNEDAFRVIHDRYRTRLFAYTRQMLAGSAQDPEDAVQEIFMRAYYGCVQATASWRCARGCTGSRTTAASTICGATSRSPSRRSSRWRRARAGSGHPPRAARRAQATDRRRPAATRPAALGAADARAQRHGLRRCIGRPGCLGARRQVAAGARTRQPRPGQRGARYRLRPDSGGPDLRP